MPLPFCGGCAEGAGCHFFAVHEGHQADEDGADGPRGIEGSRVEVAYAEAEAGGGLEAPGGSVHADCGGSEGVFGREDEGAPVLAANVGGVGGAGEDVVPFEDVGFGGMRGYVGGWV